MQSRFSTTAFIFTNQFTNPLGFQGNRNNPNRNNKSVLFVLSHMKVNRAIFNHCNFKQHQ